MVSCSCFEHSEEGKFQELLEKIRSLDRNQKIRVVEKMYGGVEYFLTEYIEYKIDQAIKQHTKYEHRHHNENDDNSWETDDVLES